MKKDEIRIVQSVLALNRPKESDKRLFAAWEQMVADFARVIKMRNSRFVDSLFLEACHGESGARKPVTLEGKFREVNHGKTGKKKAAR